MDTPNSDDPTSSTATRREWLRHRIGQWILSLGAIGLFGLAMFELAIPSFHDCHFRRARANQNAAVATLRSIVSAQAEFQSDARLDRDGDGVGEFGYLIDLGERREKSTGYLSSAFASPAPLPGDGAGVRRSGYVYQMFLPAADGAGVPETCSRDGTPDTDEAERRWCCVAWPVDYPDSGARAFFVDETEVVWWSENVSPAFAGTTSTPSFDATFVDGRGSVSPGDVPPETIRRHGQSWKPLHWHESGSWSYSAEDD